METNDYRPETAPKRRRPKKSPLLRLVWSVPFLSSVLCILCVIAGVLAFNRGLHSLRDSGSAGI